MKTFTSIGLTLLIPGIALLCSFEPVSDKIPIATVSLSDTVGNHAFQRMIDEYCVYRHQKFTSEKMLASKIDQQKVKTETLQQKKKEEEFSTRYIGELKKKPKADSIQKRVAKLDSTLGVSRMVTASIQKQVTRLKVSIDSLNKITQATKASLNNSINKLRTSSAKLSGARRFRLCNVEYYIFIANLDSQRVQTHLFNKDGKNFYSLGAVKKDLDEKHIEPLMITNAGMFTQRNTPQGLYIDEGRKIKFALDTTRGNQSDNFYLLPNGVFFIDSMNVAHINKTRDFIKIEKRFKIKIATQSGPMLVYNDSIHAKFTQGSVNAKIRSGVGKITDKKIVFALTINESNFYDFAQFFKDIFGCRDALFLDGAISEMYLKGISNETGGRFGPMISVSKIE